MKNYPKSYLAGAIAVLVVFFYGCIKMSDLPPSPVPADQAIKIIVPDNFNYKTTQDVKVKITLLTNNDKPLASVMVKVLDKPADDGGQVLFTGVTNADGLVNSSFKLPGYINKVVVDANYIGLLRNASVKLISNEILATIGGGNGYGGNVEVQGKTPVITTGYPTSPRENEIVNYSYLGTYSGSGRPNYFVTPNDVISAKLLSNINASLPEGNSVAIRNPGYLTASAESNLNIKEIADVWITFVHEGAGYQNSLAYFTYPTATPPQTTAAITTLKIVLPNASFSGSGGGMVSGNRVLIGRFQPGTSIGFCLIANGWSDNTKVVGAGLNKFFSIDALNPETSPSLRRHSVLFKDNESGVYLVGFDDQRRDQASDNDFNDLMFYATSNPPSAISDVNVTPIAKSNDQDGDGIDDTVDQFPTDPKRAYVNYYPSANSYTSVAFEDTWPNTGDYDMNDLIIDQRYRVVNNAGNNTVEIFADYVLRASGGSFSNGYGIQFPFASGMVSSVTGSKVVNNNIITIAANGTEAGQTKAVIFPFDDFFSVTTRTGNNYINTDPAVAFKKPDTIKMKINLVAPITPAQLGNAPFNPFIVCNKIRGNEAHLPGEVATDKVNTSLFGTVKDNTSPSLGRWYKTATNLPFGIALPEKFEYPIEGKSINSIYLKFEDWAKSGGTLYTDWYKNQTGYRSPNYFYKP